MKTKTDASPELPMSQRKYRPASGPESAEFVSLWCNNCKRQQDEGYCEIAARGMHYQIEAPQFPEQWQMSPEGPTCGAFIPGGERSFQRCRQTLELALEPTTS